MGHKLVSMKFYNVQWHSFHCACIRTLGEIGNANCTSFTTKLLLFAVCQMGNYTSMYVTFDRFPFDLLYHCQSKRPHHIPHNEADDISKSQLISFQQKISKISKIVTLLQNHKKNLKSIEIQIRRLHRGVSPIVAFCTVTSQHRASGDPRAICRLKKWRHYSHPIWTHIYTFVWYSAQFFIYV